MAFHARIQHILQTDSVWLTPQDNSATSGDCEALSSNRKKNLVLGTQHYCINSASYSVCVHFSVAKRKKKLQGFIFLFYWVQGKKKKGKKTLLRNIFLSPSILFL